MPRRPMSRSRESHLDQPSDSVREGPSPRRGPYSREEAQREFRDINRRLAQTQKKESFFKKAVMFPVRHPLLTILGVGALAYLGLGSFAAARKIAGEGGSSILGRTAAGGAHLFPRVNVRPGDTGTQRPALDMDFFR